jgi:hypothetical protein
MTAVEKFELAKKIAFSRWFIKRNILQPKSFSWRYIFYRLARPLLKLNYKIFKWRHGETPWTTQASIKIFGRLLEKNMVGFEYGSGNSSLYFARKIKQLTSVEHDEKWYALISDRFKKRNISNIDYKLIRRNNIATPQNQYTFYEDYNLDKNAFQVMYCFHEYFSFIRSFPDNHFDFIMIDGRARVECALNAIPKLKKDGIFVLDNSDRQRYKSIFQVLQNWPQVTTTTGLFDTTIWFKP